jgi:hypothetical protein
VIGAIDHLVLDLDAFLGLHLLDHAHHILHGGDPIFGAVHEEPGRRAGSEEGEVEAVSGGCDRDEPFDLGAAHQELHSYPRPEGDARDPAVARIRVDRLGPIERGRSVREFARAVIEGALAPAYASKIEPQRCEASVHEAVEQVVDDLVIHRAPELGVRVQHDADRGATLLRRLVAAFNAAGGAGKDDLRHLTTSHCGPRLETRKLGPELDSTPDADQNGLESF